MKGAVRLRMLEVTTSTLQRGRTKENNIVETVSI